MEFRHSLRESIEQSGEPGKKKAGAQHNYERFFEGYSEVPELNSVTGKTKFRRVYTGEYYTPEPEDCSFALNRGLYCAAYVLMWCLLLVCSAQRNVANSTWFVGLGQAACIACLGWMAVALFHCLSGGRKMKIYHYKGMKKHFRPAALGLTAAFSALCVLTLLCAALHFDGCPASVPISAVCYALCAAAAAFLYRTENRVVYTSR